MPSGVLDEGKTIGAVASELVRSDPSSLRNCVKQVRADRTKGRTGLTTEERAELATIRKENREPRMERDISGQCGGVVAAAFA